jgi:hypothetical protein
VGAGSDQITEAVHIGGYLRIAADQRWLQTVIRFQAGHRAKRCRLCVNAEEESEPLAAAQNC